jgi:hypothetical protein
VTREAKIRAMNKAWSVYAKKRAKAQAAFDAIDGPAWAEYRNVMDALSNADKEES